MSTIEWTDETWNPTVGCSRVSPGCDGCYAIRVAAREMQPAHVGLTFRRNLVDDPRARVDWTGEVRLLPDRLDTPLRWRKPRRVFVDSMSDLFHPDVPRDFVVQVWATMALTQRHTYQVLTKRPQRMASLLTDETFHRDVARAAYSTGVKPDAPSPEPLPNVWLGTSVENQRYADMRIKALVETPAAKRFLSVEPLLGPVNLHVPIRCDWGGMTGNVSALHHFIDWVIVGGESGPGARPMHPDWVRSIRDQCVAAGVPFFFKQWGEWLPLSMRYDLDLPEGQREWRRYDTGESTFAETFDHDERPEIAAVRVGKKAAGKVLDGRTWDEMPA